MSMFYPTIVSECMTETVNFYEDYFGFVPMIEREDYALLLRQGSASACIAIFSVAHACVRNIVSPVQGMIVNIVESNVKEKYETLYMEGLEIYKDYGSDINGKDHFIVYDPNRIMVNVHAPFVFS